jgi:hypothetical protein
MLLLLGFTFQRLKAHVCIKRLTWIAVHLGLTVCVGVVFWKYLQDLLYAMHTCAFKR